MKKLDFNHGWYCRCLTRGGEPVSVTLPHDAMISEPRSEDSVAEGNIGWYIGGDYEYVKSFSVSEKWAGRKVLVEFECVYHNAEVFLNGEKICERPYGYTNFYVDLTGKLIIGAKNTLRVIAHNAEQPNSRWYSGTGMFRPAWLHVADAAAYIPVNGVRVQTVSTDPAVIDVSVRTSVPGTVTIQIMDGETVVTQCEASTIAQHPYTPVPATYGRPAKAPSPAQRCDNLAIARIPVPDAQLWSPDSPHLYTCRVAFGNDVASERFGIRSLKWDAQSGLTINGERVILRGACYHHDNGVLGACSYPEAERRRVRLLKEAGYNALRSSHYPCSKYLLDACDELGMLMMDEYVDCWYIHKTKYDYVCDLTYWWQDDLRELVEKDFNHPCVIMYSTGNEVAETSQPRGIAFTREMTEYLHLLDSTRPVTCGINIFFNFLFSIGLGVYSDDKADKAQQAADKSGKEKKKKKKSAGSEFYNMLAVKIGDSFMKFGATLPPSDWKTRDAFARMDIAGYNYGINRYKHDLKKYPQRLILGSETFCKDAYTFWEIAKDNPRIIGDFVWTGMDYLGETGDGAAEFSDYVGEPETRSTGNNGRIDLSGKPRADVGYTRVAFELDKGPYIAVEPMYMQEHPAFTGWQLTKGLESWSWEGCDGNETTVEVFARGSEVELLINGASVGRSKVKKCRASFKTTYAPGEITAVSYDVNGREIARRSLFSAGTDTQISIKPERKTVRAGSLVWVPIQYTDAAGTWKPLEKHLLHIELENAELVGLGNACPYFEGNYVSRTTVKTYFGEALAVLRPTGEGDVKLSVSDDEHSASAVIRCVE